MKIFSVGAVFYFILFIASFFFLRDAENSTNIITVVPLILARFNYRKRKCKHFLVVQIQENEKSILLVP